MRKIIKNQAPQPASAFRLHYFPNIPVDGGTLVGAGSETQAGFRRMDGDAVSPSVRGRGSDLGGPGGEDPETRQARLAADGYQAGFARGEAEGRQAAEAAVQPLVAALEGCLQELRGLKKRLQQHAEHETVRLALAVAKKILVREASLHQDVILNVVRGALRQTEDIDKVQIRVNPQDLVLLKTQMTEKALFGRPEALSFEPDPGVGRGGCFIETDFGDIDARIEQQFRVVEDAFQAEMLLVDPFSPDDSR